MPLHQALPVPRAHRIFSRVLPLSCARRFRPARVSRFRDLLELSHKWTSAYFLAVRSSTAGLIHSVTSLSPRMIRSFRRSPLAAIACCLRTRPNWTSTLPKRRWQPLGEYQSSRPHRDRSPHCADQYHKLSRLPRHRRLLSVGSKQRPDLPPRGTYRTSLLLQQHGLRRQHRRTLEPLRAQCRRERANNRIRAKV